MISFFACKRCEHGKFVEPTYNGSDEMEVCPHVACDKADCVVLLMNNEPPKDCPFALEHAMFTQDETREFADWMSGGAARNALKRRTRSDYEEWARTRRKATT